MENLNLLIWLFEGLALAAYSEWSIRKYGWSNNERGRTPRSFSGLDASGDRPSGRGGGEESNLESAAE